MPLAQTDDVKITPPTRRPAAAAPLAAETDPRPVPISQTGAGERVLTKSMTDKISRACSGPARNAHDMPAA